MAETEPTSTAQSEIDAFTATQKATDKQNLLEAIFDKSVVGKSEEDRKRVEEGTEYYKHLEQLSKREPGYDDYDKQLIEKAHEEALSENEAIDNASVEAARAEQERLEAIEAKIKADPRFRRLLMIAIDVAGRRNQKLGEGDDPDKLQEILEDKERKFQELFDWYEGEGMDHDALEYILDKAFAEAAAVEVAQEVGIDPEKAESDQAFRLGQEVKVRRTSGDVEEDWKITNYFTDAFDNRTYEVGKDNLKEQNITEAQLIEWQNDTVSQENESSDVIPGEPGSEAAARENESPEEYEARMAGGAEGTTGAEAEEDAIDDLSDIDNSTLGSGETPAGTPEAEQSRVDRLKAWWGKNKDRIKDYFSPNAWGRKWAVSRVLKGHDRENMTDEERDDQKKKRRILMTLGGIGIFVGGVIVGELIAKGVLDPSAAHAVAGHGGETARGSIDALHNGSAHGTGEFGSGAGGNIVPPDANFNIRSGEGGIQLLENLGVQNPDAEWVRIQNDLLRNFPSEFYRSGSEMVRIARPGPLSTGAQNFINQALGR